MPAPQADDADIRTEPHDTPVRAAAGVRLAQPEEIVYRDIERHTLPRSLPACVRVRPGR